MNRLNNKIIIVTGGSGLIGKAVVKNITEAGGICINADINAATDIENRLIQCDITSETSIAKTIETVLQNFGRIDGLVNNAYPYTSDWGVKFEQIPVASWKQNVDMQMNSVFLFCQQVLKVMQQQKQGSVVNMGSIYGIGGPDFNIYEDTEMTMPAAYSAIKGGIINFTKYLASYYGKYHLRINCVSPGGIFDSQPESFVKKYEERVPLKRMGTPEDIAPAVSFLLSDESQYITGHNLVVDGGWTSI